MARQKSFSPEANRIFKLARKICDLFTEDELRRIAPVDPYTIQRWAEELHAPRSGNAMAMAQIIAVKESSLQAYLDGDIDLEILWSRRNEAPRVNVAKAANFDDIVQVVKNLCQTDRFRLAMIALESIKPGELNPDTNPKVVLEPRQKIRLKTLLSESMRYQRQSQKGLITAGVDPSLVDDILNNFEKDYSEQSYETLLPFLNKAREWVSDDLCTISLSEKINSLDELWQEISLLSPA
jgi:hypothetical protein